MKTSVILMSALCTGVAAEAWGVDFKNATYFCTAEISAGLGFDKSSKKWNSMAFRADEKFVLRMQYLKSRKVETFSGETVLGDFNVTITKQGSNYASPCTYDGGVTVEAITVNQYDLFKCTSSLVVEYLISVKSNRFLQTYVGEFVQGDEGLRETLPDTPLITGGTCTKIE
jgi:hypothetical protein